MNACWQECKKCHWITISQLNKKLGQQHMPSLGSMVSYFSHSYWFWLFNLKSRGPSLALSFSDSGWHVQNLVWYPLMGTNCTSWYVRVTVIIFWPGLLDQDLSFESPLIILKCREMLRVSSLVIVINSFSATSAESCCGLTWIVYRQELVDC